MNDELFFERLRRDAAGLRHQPDEVTLSRIRARIRSRLATPTVADVLAAWFRPLVAGLAAVAVAAAIGIAAMSGNGDDGTLVEPLEIVMAGDSYRVGN